MLKKLDFKTLYFLSMIFFSLQNLAAAIDAPLLQRVNSDFDETEMSVQDNKGAAANGDSKNGFAAISTGRHRAIDLDSDFDDFDLPKQNAIAPAKDIAKPSSNSSASSSAERDLSDSEHRNLLANSSGSSADTVSEPGNSNVAQQQASDKAGAAKLATIIAELDERGQAPAATNTPTQTTNGTHVINIAALIKGGNPSTNSPSKATEALLNSIYELTEDTWDKKTWAIYLLGLGPLYGYCGAWRIADYAQLSVTDGFPKAFYWATSQKTRDDIGDFAFGPLKATAFSGRVLYGCILDIPETVSRFRQQYTLNGNFPFVHTSEDFAQLETQQKWYIRWPVRLLSLGTAAALSAVDALLYKRIGDKAKTLTLAGKDPLQAYELWLAGVWDGYEGIKEDINDPLRRYLNKGDATALGQRKNFKHRIAQSLHYLQHAPDERIAEAFTTYQQQNPQPKMSQQGLSSLLDLGKDTALPDRYLRQYGTKTMALFFTALAIYPNWILGNGIVEVDATRDSPTIASAALGVLTIGLNLTPTYRGVKNLGNALIDTFAPESQRLPHANHKSEQYRLMRFLQMLHTPTAIALVAAGAAGATMFNFYSQSIGNPPGSEGFLSTVDAYLSTVDTLYNATLADYDTLTALYNFCANMTVNSTEAVMCMGNYTKASNAYDIKYQEYINASCFSPYGYPDANENCVMNLPYDVYYFYNQPRQMLLAIGYCFAVAANPIAKAINGMRKAPITFVEKVKGTYQTLKGWCGCAAATATESLSAADMRDKLIEPLLTAQQVLKTTNDSAICNIVADLGCEANQPLPKAPGLWARIKNWWGK